MSLSYQEELELRNKLAIAEFGIESIIKLCEANIDMYVKDGRDGTSTTAVLTQAEYTLERVRKQP